MNSPALKALEEYPGFLSKTVFLFSKSLTQRARSEDTLGSIVQNMQKLLVSFMEVCLICFTVSGIA